MPSRIDELAEQIADLAPWEQDKLLERVAELNFQHGLEKLSQKYRERLVAKGKANQNADEVMAELKQIRDEIASGEYRN